MFNTLQLLHRLTRKLRVRSIPALNATDKLEIMDAANSGLSEFQTFLSPARKQSPVSETVRAPLDLTLSILEGAKGFSYVSGGGNPFPTGGYTLEEHLVGHAALVNGDRNLNRLHRTGEMLAPYLGTSGQVTATFYGDVVQHGQDDRRVIRGPRFHNAASSSELIHVPDAQLRPGQSRYLDAHALAIGTPEYWWTEPLLGYERTTTPLWLLRVWPLPSVLGFIEYIKEAFPAALTLEDFTTARELPVTDREVPELLCLCEERLIGSMLLDKEANLGAITAAAARARKALQGADQPLHSEPASVGTPDGW